MKKCGSRSRISWNTFEQNSGGLSLTNAHGTEIPQLHGDQPKFCLEQLWLEHIITLWLLGR